MSGHKLLFYMGDSPIGGSTASLEAPKHRLPPETDAGGDTPRLEVPKLRLPPNLDGDATPSPASTATSSRSASTVEPPFDVLQFPIESSHAYLYAHLSPNSLALRLNVLKRSLEILRERPDLFRLIKGAEAAEGPATPPPTLRLYKVPLANTSGELHPKLKLQANASSAALAALFRPPLLRSHSALTVLSHRRSPLAPPPLRLGIERADRAAEDTYGADGALAFSGPDGASSAAGTSGVSHNLSGISSLMGTSEGLDGTQGTSGAGSAGSAASGGLRGAADGPSGAEHTSSTSDGPTYSPTGTSEGQQRAIDGAHGAQGTFGGSGSDSGADIILSDDLKDIIAILQSDASFLADNSEMALNLHQLLLASDHSRLQDFVIHKLLYALATPFVETQMTPLLLSEPPTITPANALSLFGAAPATPASARPFHAIALGKHAPPLLVFTIEADSPWPVKAANDLACLMFGILRKIIKLLTLMDLIAPQFRQFVLDKVAPAEAPQGVIFAGEIVAVVRPGAHDYAWTSIWAKRRGGVIICLFDQIPCDAFDLVVTRGGSGYTVTSVKAVAGLLLLRLAAAGRSLGAISESMARLPGDAAASSVYINETRYFTLQAGGGDNVPCAATLFPTEGATEAIKLKIHALPYIAGIFVVDAATATILLCNNAIARNLFGRLLHELDRRSVEVLIPQFARILRRGLEHNAAEFAVVPGLVLPEHFFRKYQAVVEHEEGGRSGAASLEELFVTSRGIRGVHRDGKTIWVDVQLRAQSAEVFVLWITYLSLASAGEELAKLSASASSLSLPKEAAPAVEAPAEEDAGHGRRAVSGLPLQMNLLHSLPPDELAHDGAELSRHSSTRRLRTIALGGSQSSHEGERVELVRRESEEPRAYANLVKSDAEIVALENAMLQQKVALLTQWPHTVGAKRRTKRFSEFRVLKDMGEGAYGKVVLAQHRQDPEYRIIIKCIDKERILVDTWVRDRKLGTIPLEINIMAALNAEPHPNIMRIIDFFEDAQYYYLETPLFGDPPAIDLFDFIEIKKLMTEAECKFIFKQVALALYHLHQRGIVHRDIKDENVIVDEHGIIKLIDFGSAGYAKQGPFDVFVGTIDYALPEVLRGDRYEGKPQDIWALGILLYTMIYKENPFYNVDEIMEGDLRIPFVLSEGSERLIRRILVREVANRPRIADIVEDPWLA